MSQDIYKPLASDLIQKVERYLEENHDWQEIVRKNDVAVYSRKSAEFNGMLYKAEGIINASPCTVFKYLDPTPESPRLQWDKRMAGIECLETFGSDMKIMRMYTGAELVNIISPRDFVDLVCTVENDKFIATCAVSVEYSKCPPVSGFVRGFDYPCALVCSRVPGELNKTNLINVIQPDLGGKLPSEIIDAAMPSSIVGFYNSLRDILKDTTNCFDVSTT